jgi:hypothetical protein
VKPLISKNLNQFKFYTGTEKMLTHLQRICGPFLHKKVLPCS